MNALTMPDCRKPPLNLIRNIDSNGWPIQVGGGEFFDATVAKSASVSALNDPHLGPLAGTQFRNKFFSSIRTGTFNSSPTVSSFGLKLHFHFG
jgi:hypothetical protein